MIKWTGKNTFGNITWKEEAKTYLDLYNALVDREIISTVDYDPLVKAEAEKNGLTYDDMFDDDNYIYDKLASKPEWKTLTDDELRILIESENGNAYYQTFEEE